MRSLSFFSIVWSALFYGLSAFAIGQKSLPASGLTCLPRQEAWSNSAIPKGLSKVKVVAIPNRDGSAVITYFDLVTQAEIAQQRSPLITGYERLTATQNFPASISKFGKVRSVSFFANEGSMNWTALMKPAKWEVGESAYFVAPYDCVINP